MNLTPLLITITIGIGIMLGIGGFYSEIQNTYSPTGNSTSQASFDKFNQSYSKLTTNIEDLQNRTVGIANKGILDPTKYQDVVLAFTDVAQVLVQIPNTILAFFSNMSQLFTQFIPIPKWALDTIFLVVLIVVTMKIVSIFTKTGEI